MFHMEQVGTYSESTLRKPQTTKNSQKKVDLHIRISQDNYIFLKENFRGKISETIDKLLTSFRTGEPIEIQIFKIEGFNGLGEIRTPDLLRVVQR